MKIEIVYYTKTGNTKKAVNAMASVLDVEPKNVKDAHMKDFDILLIGSGVYGGEPDKKILDFAKSLIHDKH